MKRSDKDRRKILKRRQGEGAETEEGNEAKGEEEREKGEREEREAGRETKGHGRGKSPVSRFRRTATKGEEKSTTQKREFPLCRLLTAATGSRWISASTTASSRAANATGDGARHEEGSLIE